MRCLRNHVCIFIDCLLEKELRCARHPEKTVLVRRQKAVLLDTAMLELPYHVSRIEYGAIGRNSPLLHVVHNLLCKSLVTNHQHRFCTTLFIERVC